MALKFKKSALHSVMCVFIESHLNYTCAKNHEKREIGVVFVTLHGGIITGYVGSGLGIALQ